MLARFWMIIAAVMVLTTPVVGDEIKIASWNLQRFGPAKAGLKKSEGNRDHQQNDTIGKIAEIIRTAKIDLIAIQEVQDKSFETLPKLRETLGPNWDYVESKRTGPEKGKEQYAIFFNSLKLRSEIDMHLYDVEELERPKGMERLPGYCRFETRDHSFDFTIITFHNRTWKNGAEKDSAIEDAKYLDDVYEGVEKILGAEDIPGAEDNDIILLGDFNIEGNYEKNFEELINESFVSAIPFGEDTMISKNESTLDNIFYPEGKDLTLESFDVIKFTDKKISDHYLVWAAFDIPEVDDEDKEAK